MLRHHVPGLPANVLDGCTLRQLSFKVRAMGHRQQTLSGALQGAGWLSSAGTDTCPVGLRGFVPRAAEPVIGDSVSRLAEPVMCDSVARLAEPAMGAKSVRKSSQQVPAFCESAPQEPKVRALIYADSSWKLGSKG